MRFSNLFWALRDSGLVISPTPRCREIYWFYEREERTLWRCDVDAGGQLARSTCESLELFNTVMGTAGGVSDRKNVIRIAAVRARVED